MEVPFNEPKSLTSMLFHRPLCLDTVTYTIQLDSVSLRAITNVVTEKSVWLIESIDGSGKRVTNYSVRL